jgi:cystathionine beta-lyase family protein involved in aluminum resistance
LDNWSKETWFFWCAAGLFQGPHTTGEAIKGGRLVAEVMTRLGFKVIPGPEPHLPNPPSMITAVELGSREAMVAFCKGIQLACPVGSYITPEPGEEQVEGGKREWNVSQNPLAASSH